MCEPYSQIFFPSTLRFQSSKDSKGFIELVFVLSEERVGFWEVIDYRWGWMALLQDLFPAEKLEEELEDDQEWLGPHADYQYALA
jgi:hypothetical protein